MDTGKKLLPGPDGSASPARVAPTPREPPLVFPVTIEGDEHLEAYAATKDVNALLHDIIRALVHFGGDGELSVGLTDDSGTRHPYVDGFVRTSTGIIDTPSGQKMATTARLYSTREAAFEDDEPQPDSDPDPPLVAAG